MRETAGKISKCWPNFWLELIQNWSEIVLFQGMIYCSYETHQNLYHHKHLEHFSIPFKNLYQVQFTFSQKIRYFYRRILSRISRGIPREMSHFSRIPAGNRNRGNLASLVSTKQYLTVWKFQHFSVILILRKINFADSI